MLGWDRVSVERKRTWPERGRGGGEDISLCGPGGIGEGQQHEHMGEARCNVSDLANAGHHSLV